MKSDSLGQLILTGVPGVELDSETAALFRRVQPGGFILFGRNIKSAPQLRKLIDDLRDLSEIEPIITIDQEGGRVSRLRLIGNEPPNAQQLRDRNDLALVRRHGEITGQLLRLFGFNLDLCPVLDISFDDEADNSLRGRCYGKNVEQVVRLAGAFNDALREQGILSCGKHFPGYSAATVDAHHDLPKIERSRAQLDAEELAVFRHFTSTVDSMMICHGWYPCFNPVKRPASLSRQIVTDLLRDEFHFDGLIMTDDLDMGAILNEYGLEETIPTRDRGRQRSRDDLPSRPFDRRSASHARQTAAGADSARARKCCANENKISTAHCILGISVQANRRSAFSICASRFWVRKKRPSAARKMASARPLKLIERVDRARAVTIDGTSLRP